MNIELDSRSVLAKHGLGSLETKHISLWTGADFEKVVEACRKDNLAPRLPILFNPVNTRRLLDKSDCRNCGVCCEPNPIDPKGPGLLVLEPELNILGQSSKFTLDQIMDKSVKHESITNARYLPFPCLFHNRDKCEAYNDRPFMCRIFPLSNYLLNGKVYTAVNVQCDYGKDIYISAMRDIAASSATCENSYKPQRKTTLR